ncbi:MAG: NYN domain-containing protein [bacterium]|nr:NYN domain-containing protein [bacterium]
MIVLVDAFNLIYKFPELEECMARGELESAMDGLLARLQKTKAAYANPPKRGPGRSSGVPVKKKGGRRDRELILHVFFDGKRKRGDESKRLKFAGMDLYYSHDMSADHLIMEFIKRDATPGDLLVVSTDKKIQDFARIHRCRRQSSEEFAEWMNALTHAGDAHDGHGDSDAESPGSDLSPDEVAYWEDMFREGDRR